jgi:quercetin dioxygenase-like cupin family protein
MSRSVLLDAQLHRTKDTARVEVRRITMLPGVAAGSHIHNCPTFGSIVEGSAVYQIAGEPASVLRPGDVFYEPEAVTISRFDATDEGVTFLAYFLLADGQEPGISPGDPA